MKRSGFARLIVVLFLASTILPAQTSLAVSGFGPQAIVANISGSGSCSSVRAQYVIPSTTGKTFDFRVWAYRESTPPVCFLTAPWLAHQAAVMQISSALWTTSGVFCDAMSAVSVPGGASGAGFVAGRAWQKPSSGGCFSNQFVIYGSGQWIGLANTSALVFNS